MKSMGWFNVTLPSGQAVNLATMEGYNPLVTVVNSVPSNLMNAMSTNNQILSVVVFAVVLGLCMAVMGERATQLKNVIENLNEVVQMFLNFLINRQPPLLYSA